MLIINHMKAHLVPCHITAIVTIYKSNYDIEKKYTKLYPNFDATQHFFLNFYLYLHRVIKLDIVFSKANVITPYC